MIIFGGTDEPSFTPLHQKHSDVNEVMKKAWFQKLMLRDEIKPTTYSLFWLVLFLVLTIIPGYFAGLYFTPKEFSPFFYVVRILWWMVFTPLAIISFGYVVEELFEQILASPIIFGTNFLIFFIAGCYFLNQRAGVKGIIALIVSILIPFYVLDLSRFLRKHFFPESYNS
jgi:ABC-type uncharacterized transport system permease subunit